MDILHSNSDPPVSWVECNNHDMKQNICIQLAASTVSSTLL